MNNPHIQKARKSLRDRDELRGFLQVFLTVASPIIIGIASAIISFTTDDNIKSLALTTLCVIAVLSLVFGFFLQRISSKEFFSVVFDYDDLQLENEQLEGIALNALRDSLLYKVIADTFECAQMELTTLIESKKSKYPLLDISILLEKVLSPIESMVAELFMLDKNTYYSFSVYLLSTEDDKLHSVYRKRNFNEEAASRIWATDADGSHIVSTFKRKKTSASSNIWKTDILATSNGNEADKEFYTSFVCSPIFKSGAEDGDSESTVLGVVCVTSSQEDQFGRDDDEENGILHQTSRIKTRMIASVISTLLKPVTEINL